MSRRHRKWRPPQKAARKDQNRADGAWEVTYECGEIVPFPPASSQDIESIVRDHKHLCSRPGCRPYHYIQQEAKRSS